MTEPTHPYAGFLPVIASGPQPAGSNSLDDWVFAMTPRGIYHAGFERVDEGHNRFATALYHGDWFRELPFPNAPFGPTNGVWGRSAVALTWRDGVRLFGSVSLPAANGGAGVAAMLFQRNEPSIKVVRQTLLQGAQHSRFANFSPIAGYSRHSGDSWYQSVFGAGPATSGTAAGALGEIWVTESGGSEHFQYVDHGLPAGVNFNADAVFLQRNASAWFTSNDTGFVLVLAQRTLPTLERRLFARAYRPATGWQWQDLGMPLDGHTGPIRKQIHTIPEWGDEPLDPRLDESKPVTVLGSTVPLVVMAHDTNTFDQGFANGEPSGHTLVPLRKLHVFMTIRMRYTNVAGQVEERWLIWERVNQNGTWFPWTLHNSLPGSNRYRLTAANIRVTNRGTDYMSMVGTVDPPEGVSEWGDFVEYLYSGNNNYWAGWRGPYVGTDNVGIVSASDGIPPEFWPSFVRDFYTERIVVGRTRNGAVWQGQLVPLADIGVSTLSPIGGVGPFRWQQVLGPTPQTT